MSPMAEAAFYTMLVAAGAGLVAAIWWALVHWGN